MADDSAVPAVEPSAPPIPADGTVPADVAEAPRDTELPGHYQADDGTKVALYQDGDSPDWVMTLTEAESSPMTWVLRNDAAGLVPVGLVKTIPYRGAELSMVADGDRMYGAVSCGGRHFEFNVKGDGSQPDTSVDGVASGNSPATSEEVELRAMARDYVDAWKIIRGSVVKAGGGTLSVEPTAKPTGPGADVWNPPRQLKRLGALADKDVEEMKGLLSGRKAGLAKSESFGIGKPEQEGQPHEQEQ